MKRHIPFPTEAIMKKTLAITIALALVVASAASAQDHVLKRLKDSPRHHEWVKVKQGDRTVHCFVVYPEVKDKATAVLVIHENKGLTDWVRGVADQLAEAGYVAIAPDLLSGMAPGGGKTSDLKTADEATKILYQLKPEQVTADLNAVADHILKDKAVNGKLTVAGFCWGGGQSFRFATNRTDLKAAFVFYGMFKHTKDDLAKIPCPVHGFYAENDARINESIPESKEQMKQASKTYDVQTYKGAGHGFMRAGEDPTGSAANRDARNAGWERWKTLLKKI
jgi:carboxymethylenebutenolidase